MSDRRYAGWTPITDRLGIDTYGRDVLMKEVGGKAYVKFGVPDGVQVAGFTPDGRVIAIVEERPETNTRYCHLVGETVEGEESPESAAARGFLEETGFRAGTLTRLATVRKDSSHLIGNTTFFVAEDCRKEPEAGVQVVLMSIDEFEAELASYMRNGTAENPAGGGNSTICWWLTTRWLETKGG